MNDNELKDINQRINKLDSRIRTTRDRQERTRALIAGWLDRPDPDTVLSSCGEDLLRLSGNLLVLERLRREYADGLRHDADHDEILAAARQAWVDLALELFEVDKRKENHKGAHQTLVATRCIVAL